jgi:hypothetical protein
LYRPAPEQGSFLTGEKAQELWGGNPGKKSTLPPINVRLFIAVNVKTIMRWSRKKSSAHGYVISTGGKNLEIIKDFSSLRSSE